MCTKSNTITSEIYRLTTFELILDPTSQSSTLAGGYDTIPEPDINSLPNLTSSKLFQETEGDQTHSCVP